MTRMSPLHQRIIEDLSIRNLSPETQRSYLHHVAKFSRFFGRSPDQLGYEEVRAYQGHLVGRRVSWGALNQTVCALRFFFGVTLGRSDLPERIAYPRTPRKFSPQLRHPPTGSWHGHTDHSSDDDALRPGLNGGDQPDRQSF